MVTIIGAGPVGCYTGYLLAKKGYNVKIFEEHSCVGKPVQCTGIVSKNLGKIIDVKKEFLVNTVKGARIYGPNKSCLEVRKSDAAAYILDREKFDSYWASKALNAGCELYLGERFVDFKGGVAKFRSGRDVKVDYLVGADGPLSQVAKVNGMSGQRKFFYSVQTRIKLDACLDMAEMYVGSVAPGFFGWQVPEGNGVVRLALATRSKPRLFFDRFLKMKGVKAGKMGGGLIPIYNPKLQVQKDNVFLVGDAATHVKATTGGGIIMGFLAGQELVKSIEHGDNYSKRCNNRIGKDLWLALMMRKMLGKMGDKDYNQLIYLFNQSRVKRCLESFGDMDFPTQYLLKLVLNEPRFLWYGRLLFRNLRKRNVSKL